ncbi:MAG TPA: DUF59 domain-containing protein [Chloroflexi bacterium]|nr:MAG: hypothetical protein B6243_08160 [Anaerolineaceae bacterium 4572_5.2]HEY84500.1 DUF59 domain-containing protein [Chloroflexota bacterium]
MTEAITQDNVMQMISQIEHPEIARTLVQLGMIQEVKYNQEEKEAILTLAFPIANIPESVRNYIANDIYQALQTKGVGLKVYLSVMDDQTRAKFMAQSQAYWKL